MPKLHRVGAIIQNGENIVLIHRIKNGEEYYAIPGGAIEKKETPDAAVLREIREELGLCLDSYKFIVEVDEANRQDSYFACATKDTKFIVSGLEKKYLDSPDKLFEPQWINKNNLNKGLLIYPENGRQLVLDLLK